MAEHNATMEATLEALYKEKKYKTLKDVLITMNPADVAAIFSEMSDSALPLLFRLLPKELAAESFVERPSICSPSVLPLTVGTLVLRAPGILLISASTVMIPPARSTSCMWKRLLGATLQILGVRREISSMRRRS